MILAKENFNYWFYERVFDYDINLILCQNDHFRVGPSKCGRLMIQGKYG